MKKILIITIALLTAIILQAQNQQAIVKTRGKLDNNGNVIPGRYLSGAFVKIRDGNTHESRANGILFFPVPGGTYYIDNVNYIDNETQEQYQLVDLDELGRPNKYSSTPKDIVVAGEYELYEDKLNEKTHAYDVLMANYRNRQEEIKKLQAENRITREEAMRLLQQLYEAQANSEKLVNDMVERYTKIDFDRESDFDRLFAHFIRTGQLVRADSLLRTQGNVFAMEDTLRMIQAANAEGRKIIAEKEASLSKDKASQAANESYEMNYLNKAADTYYKWYEVFSQKFMQDSAAYYLERRALLDTTNASWQFEIGKYYQEQKQYHKVELYYRRAWELFHQSENEPNVAKVLNNLANLYQTTQRFAESETMHKEALEILRRLAEKDSQAYEPDIAGILNNLANLYSDTQRFAESETMYKEALEIFRRLAEKNPQAYEPNVALILDNIALFIL